MKRFRKEPRWVSQLTVYVPDIMALLDMLRYDRCCPATEPETQKLYKLVNARAGYGTTKPEPLDHVIRLNRFAADARPATNARWNSYHCRVLDERSIDEPEFSDDEAKEALQRLASELEGQAATRPTPHPTPRRRA